MAADLEAAVRDRRLGARDVTSFGYRYAVLILGCIAVALLAGELYILITPPTYSASTQIVIEPRRGNWGGMGDASFAQYSLDSSQIENQIQIIKSEQISQRVVRGLGLEQDSELAHPERSLLSALRAWLTGEEPRPPPDGLVARVRALADRIQARRIGQSYVIEISCWSRSQEASARICNAVTGAYVSDLLQSKINGAQGGNEILEQRIAYLREQREAAEAIVRTGTFQGAGFPSADARVITTASPPEARSWPRNSLVLAFAGLLGLFLGLLAAAVHRSLDASIDGADDAERVLGADVLGSLPRVGLPGSRRRRQLAREVHRNPGSHFSAAVRQVKTSVQLRQANNAVVSIGITSTAPGEGKVIAAANLACTIADAGHRVLLIDANLRDVPLTRALAPEAKAGLVDLLQKAQVLDGVVRRQVIGRADLIPSTPDARWIERGDLLASPAMTELLALCRRWYDIVFVVLPPLEQAPDARAIAPLLDGMVLVTESRRLSADRVAASLRSLRQASDNVLGVIVSKTDDGRRS